MFNLGSFEAILDLDAGPWVKNTRVADEAIATFAKQTALTEDQVRELAEAMKVGEGAAQALAKEMGVSEGEMARFGIQMRRAEQRTQRLGRRTNTFVKGPMKAIGVVATASAGALAVYSKRVAENAESVERLSQITGISTTSLQAIRAAGDQAGFAMEQMDAAVRAGTKRIGDMIANGSQLPPVLSDIEEQLKKTGSGEGRLRLVLDRLSEFQDEGEKAAAVAAIFGEDAGPALVNAIGGGSEALDAHIARYQKLGVVLDANAIAKLATLNTTLGTLQKGIEGVGISAATEFLEGLGDTAGLTDERIAEIAETISNVAGPALQLLGENLGELLNVLVAIIEALEFLQNSKLTQGLGDLLSFFGVGGDISAIRKTARDTQAAFDVIREETERRRRLEAAAA